MGSYYSARYLIRNWLRGWVPFLYVREWN